MLNFLNLFINDALAQTATAASTPAAQQQPNALMTIAPFVLMFVVFYFLLIRPQKKKMQEERKMISSLGKGDEIFTKSGILGTIVGMNERVATIEVSEGVKFKIIKSEIGGLANKILQAENNNSAAAK